MPGYLFLLALLALLWLFLIRPRQRQMRERQRQLSTISVGDEIVTAGGLYGTVEAIDDDDLRVEVAPGVVVRMARRAVAGVVSEPQPEPEPEALPEEATASSAEAEAEPVGDETHG